MKVDGHRECSLGRGFPRDRLERGPRQLVELDWSKRLWCQCRRYELLGWVEESLVSSAGVVLE